VISGPRFKRAADQESPPINPKGKKKMIAETNNAALDLYLSLLKKSLTATLYEAEPDAENESQVTFWRDFMKHYIKGPAVSMLPMARFDNLQSCISSVVADRVPGDFIETGVWRGGRNNLHARHA
jgi:hypothetical protein